MRELTKSAISSSLALCLAGAQQVRLFLSSPQARGAASSSKNALDTIAEVAEGRLRGTFRTYYEAGRDALQGIPVYSQISSRLDVPLLLKSGTNAVSPFVDTICSASGQQQCSIAWQELRNKLDIFDLVRNVERRLDLDDDAPLDELVNRAYGLGDFHALWAIEGLGHFYARKQRAEGSVLEGMLVDPGSLGLPVESLPMLNAGLGLAFAESQLKCARRVNSERLKSRLDAFRNLCRDNATPGYVGCALESLGLVARDFYPQFVESLDLSIRQTGDESLLAYFWHGVGRANYFTVGRLVPIFPIAWRTLASLSPHILGQQNLVAGLAWAITLVNMRTPRVMHQLIHSQGREIMDFCPNAFANGVRSSIAVRLETTPSLPEAITWGRNPWPRGSQVFAEWGALVEAPWKQAVQAYHPTSQTPRAIDELFGFHSPRGP